MSKAIMGAAELAGAFALGAGAFLTGGAALAIPGYAQAMASLVISGIASEAGAIADALSSNRGMQLSKRQPAANRGVIYGTQMTGGTVVHMSTTGHQFNRVIALAGHVCHSIQGLYIDGRKVYFKGYGNGWSVSNGVGFGGDADSGDHLGPDGVTKYNFGGLVFVEARYGDQLPGDYMHSLQAQAGSNWGPSGSDSPDLLGCTYIYIKIVANGTQFPQEPEIRVLLNGKSDILDPRTGTRGFTNNAALVMADVITDVQFGMGDPNVDQAQLIAAANICDEQVAVAALGGGTESRYCCDYGYDTGTPPADAIKTMLTGMAGRLSNVGGSWFIYPGAYIGPSVSLDKSIITAPVSWNPKRSIRDLPNRVTGTHISPEWPFSIAGNWYQRPGTGTPNTFDLKFTSSSYPYYAVDTLHGYPSDQYLTEDGGHIRPLELTLTTVLSVTQCQRVAKINLMRQRKVQGSGTLEVGMGAYGLVPCDTFQFTFPELGWTNKPLEVTGTGLRCEKDDNGVPTIRYTLNVQEVDPSIYAWSTVEELTVYAAPAAPTQTPYVPVPPTNLQLVSGPATAIVNPDGSVSPTIKVSWDTPLDLQAYGVSIQYKLHSASNWWTWPDVTIDQNSALVTGIVAGQVYDVRIRTVRAGGAYSDWLEQDNFTVPTFGTFLGALSAQYPGGVNLPAPGADVTAQQPIVYAGTSESIVPNGNFVLGNANGWFICEDGGGGGGFYWDTTNKVIIILGNGNKGVGSPTFAVVPGQKYRIIYSLWAGSPISAYLRLSGAAVYANQIGASNRTYVNDFVSGGSLPTSETQLVYEWTCPPGVLFASLAVYNWDNKPSGIAVRSVVCIPYSAAGQWGADVTGANTSNNTNNVGSRPAGDVSGTILPGGGIDFLHIGNLNFPQNSTNLLLRGSFEDGSNGTWGGYIVPVTGQSFTKALRMDGRDNSDGNPFHVVPGQRIYIAGYADTTGISAASGFNCRIGVQFNRADGSTITWDSICTIAPQTAWQLYSGFIVVPADAVVGLAWLQIDGTPGSIVPNYFKVANLFYTTSAPVDFNNPGNINQGDLSKLNQANTQNIVAGAVNSSVSFQTTAFQAVSSGEHVIGQVTISTNGGYVKVFATLSVSVDDVTFHPAIKLYKGGVAGTLLTLSSQAFAPNTGGYASVTLLTVDPSPSPSQQYTLTITPNTQTAYCQYVSLLVENAKV